MSLIYCSFVLFWNQLQLPLIQTERPSLPDPGPRTGRARSDASAAATMLPLSLLPPHCHCSCCHCPCCHRPCQPEALQLPCPWQVGAPAAEPHGNALTDAVPTPVLYWECEWSFTGGFLHSSGSTDCLCWPSLSSVTTGSDSAAKLRGCCDSVNPAQWRWAPCNGAWDHLLLSQDTAAGCITVIT